MPLNIDWQQILLHLFNFVILAGGLYFILYKPVKNFMDKRTQYYEALNKEAEEKLTQAEELKAEYNERLLGVESEIASTRAAAAKEAEALANEEILQAKDEAKKIIRNAKTEAVKVREKIVKDAQTEIAKLAISATERLINDNSSDTINQFISVAKKEDNND